MLLQISEPGQSRVKERCGGRAVGIDLGTTNSLVALVEDGEPRVLHAEGESPLVPSVVSYQDDGSVIVGAEARARAAERPRDTLSSVKRFVGRSVADVLARGGAATYELTSGEEADQADRNRVVRFKVAGDRAVTAVEASAEILRALVVRAEAAIGGVVESAVITVPAYFDDAQRQATRDAGRLAGLEVLRLLAEPTAAALAYGLDQGSRGRYAVYDLGGGTFDISILELHQGVFKVVATGGDTALGGDDVDHALADRLLAAAGIEPAAAEPALLRAALDEARAAKHRLTDEPTTEMVLRGANPSDGERVRLPLSRDDLAEVMRPLLDRTARSVRRALRDADVAPGPDGELDGVILVGGSTRSPVVQRYVAELFGREPLCQLDPEKVVALGAAAQAHALTGGDTDVVLLDVIPLSLGIETMGGVVEKLIPRNSTIPARAVQTFTTYSDEQTGFDLHVVQGERETVAGNRSLARFQLKGLPRMPAGLARVEIRFEVDADGLLRVSAQELITGARAEVEVKPSYGLTDEEVERMLIDSFEHAEDDLRLRHLASERVEAERVLMATRAAMADEPALMAELGEPVRAAMEAALAEVERARDGEDYLAIRRAVEALDHASHPLAEARMNRAVAAAVRGRKLDEVAQELAAGGPDANQDS